MTKKKRLPFWARDAHEEQRHVVQAAIDGDSNALLHLRDVSGSTLSAEEFEKTLPQQLAYHNAMLLEDDNLKNLGVGW